MYAYEYTNEKFIMAEIMRMRMFKVLLTFRIPRKCYFRANFAVCPLIYFHDCS